MTASGQGCHHRPCSGDARAWIADGHTGLERGTVLVAVGGVQAGERTARRPVRRIFGTGAGASVPGQRSDDDVGIDGAQLLGTEPEPIHDADAEVVDRDVADGDEPCDNLRGIGVRQVDADTALVAVVELEQTRGVMRRRRAVGRVQRQPPEHAQMVGRLELDDVGSEVGQDLGAERTGPDPGEVADPHSLQRAPPDCCSGSAVSCRGGFAAVDSACAVPPALALVSACFGCCGGQMPPRLIDLVPRPRQLQPVGSRGEEPALGEVLVGFELGHRVHRRHGNSGSLGGVVDLVGLLVGEPLCEIHVEDVGVLGSVRPSGEHLE